MKTLLATAALAVATFASSASADIGLKDVQGNGAIDEHIMDKVVAVPGTDLIAVDMHGQLIFVTKNKRYAIVGKIIDTLQREEITNLEEVKATRRLNFKKVGLNFDELSTLTFGTGKKQVVIFADPYCPHCSAVLQEAAHLTDQYTFKLVLMPLVNRRSKETIERLVCNKDPAKAIDAALQKSYDSLPPVPPNCSGDKLLKTGITAMAFGINAVPHIFAPNGEPKIGEPEDGLKAFLEANP